MKQITMQEGSITEAMGQIDALDGLTVKEKGCLRLLTEEMYSMIAELLKVNRLDFEVTCDGRKYTLGVSTRAQIGEEARKELLSMSTDGRNAAHKGIAGVMRAMLEMLVVPEGTPLEPTLWQYDAGMTGTPNTYMWTLSQTLENMPAKQEKLDWDGMEKSIIANFADDVSIGISGAKLQMTVIKAFS